MAVIYIVEDDEDIRDIEVIALRNSNYTVQAFADGREFYQKLGEAIPDLVLLDVMLPDTNGYEILRKLRMSPMTRRIPIIMVTAKATEMDMVKGLDSGADDYIRKPFSVMELLSRVRSLLRRTRDDDAARVLVVNGVELNYEKHTVRTRDGRVELTYKEFELLRCLMTNVDVAMSRESIMLFVWGTDFEGETRTVDMHIKTLRQKLGESGKMIRTVRNVGYVIESEKE